MASVVALECGWIVTEVGRQPWIVYKVMRTEDAVTKADGVWVTFTAVVLLYAVLGAALVITLRAMARRWRAQDEQDTDVPYGPRPAALAPRRRSEHGRRRRRGAVDGRDGVRGVRRRGLRRRVLEPGRRRGERGRRARELIDWAIGPVWEANHVWLIFVLVVLWTGFSAAFAAIFSTLFIPLSLAALGIVLRGSGFAFHKTARRLRGRQLAERLFGLSSLLTPFFMGTVVGAVASGRVPVGNAAGDPVTSWLNPLSLVIGALFVATSAYLAAVFLISDARRAGARRPRALLHGRGRSAAAVAAGALAVAGIVVLHADARYVYDGLTGDGLPLVIVSALCGAAVLVLLARGARRGARPLAVGAVVAVDLGLGRRAAPVPAARRTSRSTPRRRRARRSPAC